MYIGIQVNYLFLSDSNKSKICRQFFVVISNTKFHGNLSYKNNAFPWRQMDNQTWRQRLLFTTSLQTHIISVGTLHTIYIKYKAYINTEYTWPVSAKDLWNRLHLHLIDLEFCISTAYSSEEMKIWQPSNFNLLGFLFRPYNGPLLRTFGISCI
jgi:hypothetical protein